MWRMREREERGGGDTHRRRSLQIHAAAGVLAPVLAPHEEEKQERETRRRCGEGRLWVTDGRTGWIGMATGTSPAGSDTPSPSPTSCVSRAPRPRPPSRGHLSPVPVLD
jgi:hypothetical protein